MKFKLAQDNLSKILSSLSGFMVKDAMTPIFNVVEIKASEKQGNVTFSAQNANGGIKRAVSAKVMEKGSVILTYDQIRLLASASDMDMAMMTDASKPHTVMVKAGKSTLFNLSVHADISFYDFPVPPKDGDRWIMDRAMWREVQAKLSGMTRAENTDPGRSSLSGIHLTQGYVEATDANHIIRLNKPLLPVDMVIPSSAWGPISRVLDTGDGQVVAKRSTTNHLWLMCGDGWASFSRLLDGGFPETDRVFMRLNEAGVWAKAHNNLRDAQTWTIKVDRREMLRGCRIAEATWDMDGSVATDLPAIGLSVVDGHLVLSLAHNRTNGAEVRVASDVAVADASRFSLSAVKIDAGRMAKILENGFRDESEVAIRWSDLPNMQIQVESGETVAVVGQVRV